MPGRSSGGKTVSSYANQFSWHTERRRSRACAKDRLGTSVPLARSDGTPQQTSAATTALHRDADARLDAPPLPTRYGVTWQTPRARASMHRAQASAQRLSVRHTARPPSVLASLGHRDHASARLFPSTLTHPGGTGSCPSGTTASHRAHRLYDSPNRVRARLRTEPKQKPLRPR